MNQQLSHMELNQSVRLSDKYRLKVNGEEVIVHQCDVASYAIISLNGVADMEIDVLHPYSEYKLRPLKAGLTPQREGSKLRVSVASPSKLSLELDGDLRSPLLLFVHELEKDEPVRGPGIHYYEAGKIHEAGEIRLHAGETLYLEEGAIVRGRVIAEYADGITIKGRGVLDGSNWRNGPVLPYENRTQMIKLVGCRDVRLEGITIVDGANWHVVPIACTDVSIADLNIITFEGTGDGIDVVGSENVTIQDCFIRSNDDCVAVKAVSYMDPAGLKNVNNVRVERCVLWNANWGNCLEIGYETSCESIRNVVFFNCDIIHCEFEGHQSGGTFTIHHGDRAAISDIHYENIRVEDAQEKLFDIKILHSKYSRDEERGSIRGIVFKDIQVVDGPYPVSIIRGWDEEHMVEDIVFDNIIIHGEHAQSAREARMVVELARDIHFL
ncbi:glycoside hydrolase family 28 protein [Paenibacillus sp. GCM10023252]|uniref:glycoside hydrolase family 28 protein n=1 Tax=Paenibacillus sp. GCM10023252 TaxID=3252649 RepID=UPI00360BCF91